jgi:NADH-quinone oxidoreductase subunit H
MILMSSLVTIFFLGGWLPFFVLDFIPYSINFALKTLVFIIFFIWARAAYPRYRYDQLMDLGWKVFLPFSIGYLLFISGIFLGFGSLAPSFL